MSEPEHRETPPPPRELRDYWPRIYWVAWWSGTALIVASWADLGSNTIGWVGFGIAGVATTISVIVNRFWRMP